jgi:hypothetical protein
VTAAAQVVRIRPVGLHSPARLTLGDSRAGECKPRDRTTRVSRYRLGVFGYPLR